MPRGRPLELDGELLEAFRQNGLVNEYLVGLLPSSLWRADPPGRGGRSIAAIVAHMQSVRRMFARSGGARPGPSSLDRLRSTPLQAQRALRESTAVLAGLFEVAIAAGQARVKGMPRRVVNMMAYLMQHDAHHRGQICWLARELGHQFRSEDIMRLWGWKALVPTDTAPRKVRSK
jgi:uncharacterized damage-inducible protein DinB